MVAILLQLKGILQSYTVESTQPGYKRTHMFPTRSAVIGLCGAALGYLRNSSEIADLDSKLQVYVDMGVDNEEQTQPGFVMVDFQTAGGGNGASMPKADSCTAHRLAPIMNKEYLCDGNYFVWVSSADENLMLKLQEALKDPVFPLYLGRKSCIPSNRIYVKTINDFVVEERSLKECI